VSHTYPTCGGSCPPFQTCVAISDLEAGDSCGCVSPAGPCGDCAEGEACLWKPQSPTPQLLGCAPIPTCYESQYGACTGGVPAGYACQAVDNISDDIFFSVERCEAVPATTSCSHVCGPAAGVCPAGEVCIRARPGTRGDCGCAEPPLCHHSIGDESANCPDSPCLCAAQHCGCPFDVGLFP
jgi:hypothetical protein